MGSTGVLSVELPPNVRDKMGHFGLQESRGSILAHTQNAVKAEEIGTALPRSCVPLGNAGGPLHLAPQTAALPGSDRTSSAGPATQVCRVQPATAPRAEHQVAAPAASEPPHVANAPLVDPMDALLELSRAADMLSSLGTEPAAPTAASVDVAPVSTRPTNVAPAGESTDAARVDAALPSPPSTDAADESAASPATLQPCEDAPASTVTMASGAVAPPSDRIRLFVRERSQSTGSQPRATSKPEEPGEHGAGRTKDAPKAASKPKPQPSATSKRDGRARRGPPGSVMTAIGAIKLGDHLDVKWIDGDGQFYTATVTALTDAGVTIVYPQSAEWDEWDEDLCIDDFVEFRVKRAAAAPMPSAALKAASGLKRKHPDGSSSQNDGAGCTWTKGEDAHLQQLVRDEGVGNWDVKASKFSSARTANALRQRWCSHLSRVQMPDDEAASVPAAEEDRVSFRGDWSFAEDQQLRRMVARQGTGNWETKADNFNTDRSAAALRFRWYKLSKESGHVHCPEREIVDARWSTREDRQLQSMVRTDGSGNWRQKAEAFDTDRSADALRFRWYVLQKEEEGGTPESDGMPTESPVAITVDKTSQQRDNRSRSGMRSEHAHPAPNPQQMQTPSAWLPAEDSQLRALVHTEGSGNWQLKADRFKTNRSAGALRFRWYVLKEEDEEAAKGEHNSARGTSSASGAVASKKRPRERTAPESAGSTNAKTARVANEGQRPVGTVSEWSTAEDKQLHELVASSGAGNWKAKSRYFKKRRRSPGSLRTRWAYLKDNGVVIDPTDGESLKIRVPEASINEEDQEWRSALKQDFTCLCLYSKSWYEVRVTEVTSEEDGVRSTRRNGESVKVHYVGWKNYYDEWVPRLSQRLWSQGSTPRWFRKYELVEGSESDASEPLRSHTQAWTKAEDAQLMELCDSATINWAKVAKQFDTLRTADSLHVRWAQLEADSECAVESEADDDAMDANGEDMSSTRSGTASGLDSKVSDHKPLLKSLEWTEKEDKLLKKLIETSGASDWESKAKQFHDRRSAGALRRRWCLLRDEIAEEGVTDDAKRAPAGPWTEAEDSELAKLVKKSGANDWDEKAAQFTSGSRSAGSLRYRWTYILQHNADAGASTGDGSNDDDVTNDSNDEDDDLSEDDTSRFDPPSGSIRERAAAKEDRAWRAGLAVGSICSCFSHNELFPAKVVDTRPAKPGRMGMGMVKVHYQGWSSKYDAWFSRTSSRLHRAEAAGQSRKLQQSSAAAKVGTTSTRAVAAAGSGGAWSAQEDKQLRAMCARDGFGDWDAKATRFTAGERTASSLRQRWSKLQSESSQQVSSSRASTGGAVVGHWSEQEDAELRKMATKTRKNWDLMASRFITERSASALRRRWYTLVELDGEDEDGEGGSSSDDEDGGSQEASSASSWLPAEDAELRQLVAESGSGDWETKAAKFSTNRSSGALRFRWYHLRDADSAAAATAPAPASPGATTGWTSAEDAQLKKLVKQTGAGDWEAKAAAFKTSRSSSSIRHRWFSYLATDAEDPTATSSRSQGKGKRSPRLCQSSSAKPSSLAAKAPPTRTLRSRGLGYQSPAAVTDEDVARELQRELNGVRKRETARYNPVG